MADVKYVDLAEWQKLGGLQEANRLFFHAHGWALEATRIAEEGWDDASPTMQKRVEELADAMIAEAEAQGSGADDRDAVINLARKILGRLYPPGTVYLSGIWDSDDPEGIVFGSWSEGDVAKADAVHVRRLDYFKARSALFRGDDGPWCTPQDPGEEDESDIEPFDYVWGGPEE